MGPAPETRRGAVFYLARERGGNRFILDEHVRRHVERSGNAEEFVETDGVWSIGQRLGIIRLLLSDAQVPLADGGGCVTLLLE